MMEEKDEKKLCGIIPPMITPLLDHRTLDIAGLERLVEYLLAGGVHGLFLLGTTGEGPSLNNKLRRDLIQNTTKVAVNRVPTLVCITDTSLAMSVELAKFAADCGAEAVVASTPYYYPITQKELQSYIRQLAQAVPLPLYLYNIPQMTRMKFEIETVRQLLDVDQIVGMKDSSGDFDFFQKLQRTTSQRDDFVLLTGVEEKLVEAMGVGADGGVCGGANLFPQLHVNLYSAIRSNNYPQMESLRKVVLQVSESLYHIQKTNSRFVNALKGALAQRGICRNVVAPPMQVFSELEQQLLIKCMNDLMQIDWPATPTVLTEDAKRASLHNGRVDPSHSPHLKSNLSGELSSPQSSVR